MIVHSLYWILLVTGHPLYPILLMTVCPPFSFLWHYGPLSLTLASLVILAHFCLPWALYIHLLIPNVLMSVWTSANYLKLGLPIFRFLSSLAFKIVFGNLKFSIRTTWPSHSNLLLLISDIILVSSYIFWSSKLVLIRQTPFSHLGP
jgi:hypothetical protein